MFIVDAGSFWGSAVTREDAECLVAEYALNGYTSRIIDVAALESERDRLREALRNIEHATAPSHDDGAHHENAHSLDVEALAVAGVEK